MFFFSQTPVGYHGVATPMENQPHDTSEIYPGTIKIKMRGVDAPPETFPSKDLRADAYEPIPTGDPIGV